MESRLLGLWARVRESMWLLPGTLAGAGVLLAVVTVTIDRRIPEAELQGLWLVFGAGAEGARGVLATIAGSIITVTGVVFSVTIVALQLASGQFTPRVLRSFTGDRTNQLVLGVFIGTFTYSLLVLRTVRSAADDYERFVPSLSVTTAVLLALVSIAFLIVFVDHIARSIQVEIIIERVTADALAVVDSLFPDPLGELRDAPEEPIAPLPTGPGAPLLAAAGGYIQAIDETALASLAEAEALTVRLERRIGDFVVTGDVLGRVWPGELDADRRERVEEALRIGPERTRHQDVERGLIELTDIGVRALSPGVNDPTTAIVCVDRLSEVLSTLGRRRFPSPVRRAADGRLLLVLPVTDFGEIFDRGFRQLRHHAAGDPTVTLHLVETLGRLAGRLPVERRRPVMREIREAVRAANRRMGEGNDLRRIKAQAGRSLGSCGDDPGT